ncbi:hypothetical protein BAC2_00795 [uncultured bacterium]|nr:hypothetical protein BAC2_00795 [uncultured bacterium]
MNAETAYLFRHTLLRDAAYQLQLPGDRARLHGLALEIIERGAGVNLDALAAELAEHALRAQSAPGADRPSLRARELDFLQRAAHFARRNFLNEEAVALFGRIASRRGLDTQTRTAALREAGGVLRMTAASDAAIETFKRALRLATGLKDQRELGAILNSLGAAYNEAGNAALAKRTLNRALLIHRRAHDRAKEALALGTLNTLRFKAGEFAAAERGYREVLAIFLSLGDEAAVGRTLVSLGTALNWQSRYAEAEPLYIEALEILRKYDDLHYRGITLMNLAALYAETKRKEMAEPVFREALALNQRVGNRKLVGFTLGNLARLAQELGRAEESLRWLAQARVVLEALGDAAEIAAIVRDLNSERTKRGLPLIAP